MERKTLDQASSPALADFFKDIEMRCHTTASLTAVGRTSFAIRLARTTTGVIWNNDFQTKGNIITKINALLSQGDTISFILRSQTAWSNSEDQRSMIEVRGYVIRKFDDDLDITAIDPYDLQLLFELDENDQKQSMPTNHTLVYLT